jgi:hypothetical protein
MGVTLLWSGQLAAATKALFSAIEVRDSLRAPGLSDANKICSTHNLISMIFFNKP